MYDKLSTKVKDPGRNGFYLEVNFIVTNDRDGVVVLSILSASNE